jgi:secondary thiamine-phosphate synthase enzyme
MRHLLNCGDSELTVVTKQLSLNTEGEGDIIDLTGMVSEAVHRSGVKNGMVTVFVPGATGALTTIEYEPGLLQDFPNILERVAPKGLMYEHEKRWHDGNGHSHVRASLIGPSLTVPVVKGELTLGTWQQIVFLELDVRNRSRKLILQIMGE